MKPTHVLRSLLALTAAAATSATACSGSSDGPLAPNIETTTFAATLGVNIAGSTKTSTGLYYRDITVGSGAAVTSGMALTVRYTGWLPNGTQFDANQSPATPFAFTVGVGQVIAGWDQGFVGMKVGGRRQLVIPPSLGYGSQSAGSIPANSILVFTVDVLTAR